MPIKDFSNEYICIFYYQRNEPYFSNTSYIINKNFNVATLYLSNTLNASTVDCHSSTSSPITVLIMIYLLEFPGVTVPTLHVGMVFSTCCWYRDPHALPWIEYLHTGSSKIWYAIPDSMSKHFHATLLKLVPNYCQNKSIWLPSDTAMVPPNLLTENGVSLCRTVQEPGQFIVVFPKVFTSSISTGYVVSESVYFAPSYWLQTAREIFDELKRNCEPSMFSIDRLLVNISFDSRSSVDILRQVVPAMEDLSRRERELRSKLRQLGLTLSEKLPSPDTHSMRKRKKLLSDNNDYECESCRTNLFISLVCISIYFIVNYSQILTTSILFTIL